MKFLFTSALLILMSILGISQTIRVIDENSLQGIENVVISDDKQVILTNNKGEAEISTFKNAKVLEFQHPSYKTTLLSYEALKVLEFKVKLSEQIIDIDEVVIVANKWEQNRKEVPSKITKLNAKEIAFDNPQTAADLLANSSEVFVQKSQLGGGSPMIRGFSTNRILIVVDGVRMNNAIYRSGNLQNIISLDPNSIENAEVIFGPGSVIYGSDAIGGVMDFHTLTPQLSTTNKLHFSANAMSRFSSANMEKTGHFDFTLGQKKWSLLSSISYSDFGDLEMGSHGPDSYTRPTYVESMNGSDQMLTNKHPDLQKFTGYHQSNILQKLRYKPNQYWDLQYAFHYSELSDVPRYDRLIQYKGDRLKYAEWYYGPQKWMMNALNIKYTKANSFFDEAKLTAAYQDYEESRHDRKFGKDKIRERTEQVEALSVNLDLDKRLTEESHLFYGLEWVNNSIHSSGQERNIYDGALNDYASRYPDASDYSSYAAYVNYKNNLNSKLTLVSGIRYSQILLNADFDTRFYPFPFQSININTGALNGSLGLVFRPRTDWQFNLNSSTGFRAPNMDDVGKVFDSEPGSVVVPNEDLKSEYAYNVDLGIIKTITDRLQVEATVFYTLLKNAMVRRDFSFAGENFIMYDGELSQVQALVNTDQAHVYGVQFAIKAELTKHLSFKSHLSYTKGEDQDGLPLRHVAPLFGSSHFIVKHKQFKADLFAQYNAEVSFKNLSETERAKPYMYDTDQNGDPYSPAWVTLNFKTSYQMNQFLQLSAGIDNILDLRYRPYSSGIVAPGRNLMLSLRAHF